MIIAKKKRSYANSIYNANFLLGSIIDIDSMKSEKRIQHRKLYIFLIPITLCLYIDQGQNLFALTIIEFFLSSV